MTSLDDPVQIDDEFVQDPHRVVAAMRARAPLTRIVLRGGIPAWLVSRYAEARALLADPRLKKDAGRAKELIGTHIGATGSQIDTSALNAHLLNSDPPDHTRLRKLVNKAFTGRAVAGLRPRIEEITGELLDAMAGKTEVDLLDAFAFPLPMTVICELLGVPPGDREEFRGWSNAVLSAGEPDEVGNAVVALTGYLHSLVENRRATPGDDLISALIHATDEGDRLTERELVSMVFLLLIAGHETTVNLIGNGVLELLRHPGQLAALRADPRLLPGAVEELLRFRGPVDLATLRFTDEPIEIGGVRIPEGQFVLVSLLGANRDGAHFPDPDRLDITRPGQGHLAFGHGIHFCVGAPLARLEGEIAIGKLLARFGDLRLAADPGTLRWRNSTLIHGLERLPVRLA